MPTGKTSSICLDVQPLEGRLAPAARLACYPVGSALFLQGTNRPDQVQVRAQGGRVVVTAAGAEVYRCPAEQVRQVLFFGRAGADSFVNLSVLPCFCDGGAGADFLRGGAGTDYLLGGPGGDQLHGGRGDDFLFGGPGRSDLNVIQGEEGFDRYVGFSRRDWVDLGIQTPAVVMDPAALAREVIDRSNAYRQQYGLRGLQPNGLLARVAQAHAENMARHDVMAHVLEGKDALQRLRDAGYQGRASAENIAAASGYDDLAATFVALWVGSADHQVNLVGSRYTQTGVGVAQSASGTYYAVQLFGA